MSYCSEINIASFTRSRIVWNASKNIRVIFITRESEGKPVINTLVEASNSILTPIPLQAHHILATLTEVHALP